MGEEPIRKRIDFAERAQSSYGDALHGELLVLEENEKVTLRRRDALRHLEKVDGLWQAQFRKAANLEPADTEQNARRNSLLEKLNRKQFAVLRPARTKTASACAAGSARASQARRNLNISDGESRNRKR